MKWRFALHKKSPLGHWKALSKISLIHINIYRPALDLSKQPRWWRNYSWDYSTHAASSMAIHLIQDISFPDDSSSQALSTRDKRPRHALHQGHRHQALQPAGLGTRSPSPNRSRTWKFNSHAQFIQSCPPPAYLCFSVTLASMAFSGLTQKEEREKIGLYKLKKISYETSNPQKIGFYTLLGYCFYTDGNEPK